MAAVQLCSPLKALKSSTCAFKHLAMWFACIRGTLLSHGRWRLHLHSQPRRRICSWTPEPPSLLGIRLQATLAPIRCPTYSLHPFRCSPHLDRVLLCSVKKGSFARCRCSISPRALAC